MTLLLLTLMSLQLSSAASDVLLVSVLGQPEVRHVSLEGSATYWGNDVEFSQQVVVLDSMSHPVAGRMVTVSARTRDGVVARVLSEGVTDAAGHATVRAAFELASADMRVSLQACVVNTDFCSALQAVDLREKLTLELTFSMALVGQAGDEQFVVGRSQAAASFVEYADRYAVDGRVSYAVWDRGAGVRRVSLSAYAGLGVAYARGDHIASVDYDDGRSGFGYGKDVTLNPGAPSVGISGVFSRVAVDASVSRATEQSPGNRRLTVLGFQPLSDRVALLGGLSTSQPTSVRSAFGGGARAPFAGLAVQTASRRTQISGSLAWVNMAASTFNTRAGQRVSAFESDSMQVNGSIQHYGGGPWGLSWFFSLGGLGTDVTTFQNGLYLTLKNPLPGLF
jgi:hypothetical protein